MIIIVKNTPVEVQKNKDKCEMIIGYMVDPEDTSSH